MPELQSPGDAQSTVATLFKVKKDTPATVLDDYAKIAWFFTQKPIFENALRLVSEKLWDKYREYQGKNPGWQRNLFTTAIRDVSLAYGWQYDGDSSVVLVGAVPPEKYLEWTSQGQFFKDDMDLKHGEHTHTFQWLAVALERTALGLTNDPSYLYKNSFNVMTQSKKELIVPGFKSKTGIQGPTSDYSIWAWVADCFPTSFADGKTMPQGASLFSDTYRTPQILMQYLLDTAPSDHFIAEYLRIRYKKRNWFTDGSARTYANVSGGATAKTHAVQQHTGKPGWSTISTSGSPTAFTKDAGANFRTAPKDTVLKKFHGKNGYMTKPD